MSRRTRRKRQGLVKGDWMVKAVLGGIAVLLLGGFLLYLGINRYLHSERFRNFLAEKVGSEVGLDGRFSPFQWDGFALNVQDYEGVGNGLVQRMQMDRIHTEVGLKKVTQGKWQIKDTTIQRLDVVLGLKGDASDNLMKIEEISGKGETKSSGWLPKQVEVQGVNIERFDSRVITSGGIYGYKGGHVVIDPVVGGGKEILLTGGQLTMPWIWFPKIEVERAKVRNVDKQVFLKKFQGKLLKSGTIDASGEWDQELQSYTIEGIVDHLSCEELVSKDWVKHVQGKVRSEFQVRKVAMGRPLVASGVLTLENGQFTALPIFDALGAYADTSRFRMIPLKEAHVEWAWSENQLQLTNLVLSSESLIRLTGRLSVTDGQLDGQFRLGIIPGILARIPGAESQVFQPGSDGLLWTDLRVSGTLKDPKEDLSARLMAAAGARMFEVIPETGQRVFKNTRTAVQGATEQILKPGGLEGGKLIESGVDVVRAGVGSVIGGIFGGGSAVEPAKPQEPVKPEEQEKPKVEEPVTPPAGGKDLDEKAKGKVAPPATGDDIDYVE